MNPSSIADHLQALGEGRIEPHNSFYGLCSEFMFQFSAVGFKHFDTFIQQWPEFSGDRVYPIKSFCWYRSAKGKYASCCDKNIDMWDRRTNYGQARRRLCLYLAQRFREIELGEK